MLVKMFNESFKTYITVFNGKQKCQNGFDVTLTDNFQYQSQSVITEIITQSDQRKTVQITDKNKSQRQVIRLRDMKYLVQINTRLA